MTKVTLPGIVSSISSDSTHTLFLTSQGEIFVTGWNRNGCLGLGSLGDKISTPIRLASKEKFVSVSAGEYSAAVS